MSETPNSGAGSPRQPETVQRPRITPFLFEGEGLIRVMDRSGDPWFIAADVCRTIGLGNATMAVRPLDDDEKGISSIETPGGPQEVIVISEGGLYTLILRSRDATKPGTVAHRFRKWVTSEVLPTIRRTGGYSAPEPERDEGEESETPDGLKLRKVNTASRVFGERAGAQLWVKLGLDWVPAMAAVVRQADIEDGLPKGTVQIMVLPPKGGNGGAH